MEPERFFNADFETRSQHFAARTFIVERATTRIQSVQALIRRNVLLVEVNRLLLEVRTLEREIAQVDIEIASFDPDFDFEIEALQCQQAGFQQEVARLRGEIKKKRAEASVYAPLM